MVGLEDAILLAVRVHLGQKRKSGDPYIFHPLRVMLNMRSERERIVAVLHDVLEMNSAITADSLRRDGYSDEVVEAVVCLTRREEETYEEYIRNRVKPNAIARKVKMADIKDNLSGPDGLESASFMPIEHQRFASRIARYQKALKDLA